MRRKQRTQLADMEQINQALRILETADLLKLIEGHSGPKGGAPMRLYSVNPVMHEAE